MPLTHRKPPTDLPAVSSLTGTHRRCGGPLVPGGGPTIARKRSMPARSPFRVSAPLVLCVLFLTAGSGACSYIFVDGPPEKHRQLPYFTCTTSRAWPVVDTVLGAAYAIDAVGFASLASRQSGSSTGGTEVALIAGGAAVLFAASAVSGYGKASACREATEELQVRLTRMQPAPGFGFGQQGVPPYQPPAPYDPWVTPPPHSVGAPPSAPPGAGAPTPESNPPPAPKGEAPGQER
jgi:hypothetical protein